MNLLIQQSPLLYGMSLRLRGGRRRPSTVSAPWMNRALRTADEAMRARALARRAGLPPHKDTPKNWDALAALHAILARGKTTGRVLDAGGEVYSPLIEWLYLYGYRDLHVINLAFDRPFRRGSIQYQPGDCTCTPYFDASFDAITCLSVIEHGVDLDAFGCEAARLLAPGGLLVVSTDYWSEPVDTFGHTAYGVPVQIFTPADIGTMIEKFTRHGLVLTGPFDPTTEERVVHWRRLDLRYTFAVLAFKKAA